MEFPEHLVKQAEEVFEVYFNRDPRAEDLYRELKKSVKEYVAANEVSTDAATFLGELCLSVS